MPYQAFQAVIQAEIEAFEVGVEGLKGREWTTWKHGADENRCLCGHMGADAIFFKAMPYRVGSPNLSNKALLRCFALFNNLSKDITST